MNEDKRQVQDGFCTWRSMFGAIIDFVTLSAKPIGLEVWSTPQAQKYSTSILVKHVTYELNVPTS